ncbi:enoyl-CoA hydratase/isomerase family protein [Anaerobacillus sp. CMMVII]|uniref:enoyl-CoA hydratase/isomerase family protein n=1 Tax=Anaerobacillus sp. CMMVII TaxID=2755588 RepID=UPI0021B7E9F9|nr:enoyl-CoA hydratase/isomerase family protein [Anaerobacillus sp. CMMVII]
MKIVVLTGAGTDAFCSGGDLSIFHHIHTKGEAKEMLLKMAKVLHKLFFFSKPTVAYLNGTTVGGGCEIATACDFRIAEKKLKIGFIQGRLGITTGWGGSTYLMERSINKTHFKCYYQRN